MSKDIKDIIEILELAKEEIENNDENITATLDLQDLKSLKNLYDLYQKEKEKNKKLEEQLRKVNEYIRNEMYINDNPTICGDEEDTITELPISLNLHNEDLRELLELLEERN